MYERNLNISLGKTVYRSEITPKSFTWNSFIRHLSDFRIIPYKVDEYERLEKKEQAKLKDKGYFIFGAFNEENVRKTENMLSREGITLDYDNVSYEEMKKTAEILKNCEYNYLIYSTASYNGNNGKFRVVIPFSKSIAIDRYMNTTIEIVKHLGLSENIDEASLEPNHSFNLPTRLMEVKELFDYADDRKYIDPEQFNIKMLDEKPKVKELNVGSFKYNKQQAIELVSKYVKTNELLTYESFLPAYFSIIKGYQEGEIDYETAENLMTILANGNPEYEENNLKMFKRQFNKTVAKTEYSFQKRFDFKKEYQQSNVEDSKIEEFKSNRKFTMGSQFNDLEYKEPLTYVKNMIPQGVGFFGGSPKTGKSFLAIQMLMSIATGTNFLGYETKKSNTLYYSLEMDENLVVSRLRKMYGNAFIPDSFITAYDLPSDQSILFEVLEQDIIETNAKVVIIDTHGIISSTKKANSPLYEQSYDEIRKYKKISDMYQVSIILVTHLNKNSAGLDPFDRIIGSTANRGSTDFNCILSKEDEGKYRFQIESRKLMNTDLILSKNTETLKFEVEGTANEIQVARHRDNFINNPIIKVINENLKGKRKLESSASEILDLIPVSESFDDKGSDLTPEKVGRNIRKYQKDLKNYLNINLEISRSNKGTIYSFYSNHS